MTSLAAAACVGWFVLWCLRGGFWRADQRLPTSASARADWPSVSVVIPARNEVASIAEAVRSLVAQRYEGAIDVVVVDDASADGTAAAARAAAAGCGRVAVIPGEPLPRGWSGKLWALDCGLREARRRRPDARYVLLTDADIVHAPTVVARLVDLALDRERDLVSVMALLHCASPWERLLVPAFVFYFQKLYPFSWVNDARRPEAAAAGGCMLVRRDALDAAGGVGAIRDRLIDDCALAAAIKCRGPIWLGLSEDVQSVRAYAGLGPFWTMVARTAFTQLDYSMLRLAGAVAMMLLLYAVPPLTVVVGLASRSLPAAALGAVAWLLMIVCTAPTLKLYRLAVWRGAMLPVAGMLYTAMTLDSARQHRLGRGGLWKGRVFAGAGGSGA
ncbi:MAG: glycosyltransferase [Rhodospirillales bacterium]|nr:glycosyltransferase [Rhodospirillales bacterium]